MAGTVNAMVIKAQGLGSNKPTSGGTKNWTDLVNRIENGE
jgi:hypothetical protein